MKKSILIYNQFPIVRTGLEFVLKNMDADFDIYIAEHREEIINFLNILEFDLLFIDINNNGFNEISIIKKFKIIQPNAKIVIFSIFDDLQFNDRCFKNGASGILNKTCSNENICQMTNVLLFGVKHFKKDSKFMFNNLEKTRKHKLVSGSVDTLSTREYELAMLLITGESGINISKKLNLATTTISTYKKRIFIKTNTVNILQLAEVIKKSMN